MDTQGGKMSLPQFQSDDKDFQMLQNRWASILNPYLTNPSLKSIILRDVPLVVGSNSVNHRLGRKLQGWRLVRVRSSAQIYDNQDANQSPELTLLLVSNAAVSVDLECF